MERASTDLGNLAVAGMAGLAAMVALAALGRRDLAFRLAAGMAIAFGATFALKIVSANIGPSFTGTILALSVGAPSGHVSMAVAIYGGVATACWRYGDRAALPATLALAAIVAVGITRVTLRAHTPADVVAGLLVGGAALAISWRGRGGDTPPVRVGWVTGASIAGAVLTELSPLRVSSNGFF